MVDSIPWCYLCQLFLVAFGWKLVSLQLVFLSSLSVIKVTGRYIIKPFYSCKIQLILIFFAPYIYLCVCEILIDYSDLQPQFPIHMTLLVLRVGPSAKRLGVIDECLIPQMHSNSGFNSIKTIKVTKEI